MPKINVETSYFNHPKTRRLRVYCGAEADIYPIRLWAFCAEYFPKDGILRGYSGSEIEGMLGYNGISGNLIKALLQVNFVVKNAENYEINDWKQHAYFIWKYKIAGRKAGKKSAQSRRKKQSNDRSTTVQRSFNDRSTIELNGIEWNKDTETTPKNEQGNNVAKKPTLQEIEVYCKQRNNKINPRLFFDHYEANGWIRGKTKIKNWQACVRTWESRNHSNATEKPREVIG